MQNFNASITEAFWEEGAGLKWLENQRIRKVFGFLLLVQWQFPCRDNSRYAGVINAREKGGWGLNSLPGAELKRKQQSSLKHSTNLGSDSIILWKVKCHHPHPLSVLNHFTMLFQSY